LISGWTLVQKFTVRTPNAAIYWRTAIAMSRIPVRQMAVIRFSRLGGRVSFDEMHPNCGARVKAETPRKE
jgi:hypothetical protein